MSDPAPHPENSDEAVAEIRAAERRQFLEQTGGSFHPESAMGFTVQRGLTLRDYFAGQALLSIKASWGADLKEMAEVCYRVADFMIEARKAVARG